MTTVLNILAVLISSFIALEIYLKFFKHMPHIEFDDMTFDDDYKGKYCKILMDNHVYYFTKEVFDDLLVDTTIDLYDGQALKTKFKQLAVFILDIDKNKFIKCRETLENLVDDYCKISNQHLHENNVNQTFFEEEFIINS